MKTALRCLVAACALAATAARADITIGVTLSLTGPLSSLGLPIKASLPLWPERIAGEKVRLIVLDDASDSTGAVRNARRFVTEDKVDVILGSSGVPAVFAIAPVAAEAKTVQLAFAPAPRPGGKDDWTFPLPQPVTLMSDAVAQRMVADKVRTVAFLGWNEGYGEMWLGAFGASAKKAGPDDRRHRALRAARHQHHRAGAEGAGRQARRGADRRRRIGRGDAADQPARARLGRADLPDPRRRFARPGARGRQAHGRHHPARRPGAGGRTAG